MLRTLQRRIRLWRAKFDVEREVYLMQQRPQVRGRGEGSGLSLVAGITSAAGSYATLLVSQAWEYRSFKMRQ